MRSGTEKAGFRMSSDLWNERIQDLPGASILQTSQWAEVKARGGWESLDKEWLDEEGKTQAAALILKKPLNIGAFHSGWSFLYIPRGPMLDWMDTDLRTRVLDDISKIARQEKAVFVKIDPDVPVSYGEPGTEESQQAAEGQMLLQEYKKRGWIFSPQQIQFANSVWINVTADEGQLLSNMKQRTRYKIRLAQKKGVMVRRGTEADFPLCCQMYVETSARDGFLIRDTSYYLDVWQRFSHCGMLTPLIAEVDGQACAAVMIFYFAKRAWYIYGMSRDLHRELMPNYLLQWEAIRLAKEKGCETYDLWGAPDHFNENDRMWGVYQFKRGLGGKVVNSPGAWDLPVNRPLYRLFVHALPKFLGILKRRRHSK